MNVAAVAVARNEENMIGQTLRSLLDQTIPVDMVLLDDGSTDETPTIARELGIPVISLPYHSDSYVGRPELALRVNIGVNYTRRYCPDYVMHTGGDHIFPPDYCETLIEKMETEDGVVVASGSIWGMKRNDTAPLGSGRMIDAHWWEEVHQMTYPIHEGWESWIVFKAQMMGLKTRCFPEPLSEGRPVAMNSRKARGWGRGMYALGYHPVHAALRSLLVAMKNPRNGTAMLKGYLFHNGVGRLDTAEYLYEYQKRTLPGAVRRRIRL